MKRSVFCTSRPDKALASCVGFFGAPSEVFPPPVRGKTYQPKATPWARSHKSLALQGFRGESSAKLQAVAGGRVDSYIQNIGAKNRKFDYESEITRARPWPYEFVQDQSNNLPVREAFASTHWSLVLCARQTNPDLARQALENLCQTYWYPLYAFARRRGESLQDSADVTQGFFAQLLENDALSSVSPEKGRFRAFLLASFKNYLANHRRGRDAVKRGGCITILSIDRDSFERQYQLSTLHTCTPETLYERCWAEALLGHVLELLRQDYEKGGRGELFAALHPYLAGGLPKSEVAARLGSQPAAIAMAMHRLRRRYAELMRREIGNTVDDPREVEDELNRLRAILAKP